MPPAEPITVVLTRRVARASAVAFEAAYRELAASAAAQPGHLAAELLRGADAGGVRLYHLIYRFRDGASLRAWETSPDRRLRVAQIERLALGGDRRDMTGLEVLIDLPAGAVPARWRMACVTWGGIWPLVSLALWLIAPALAALPFLVRTAAITALVVLTMTYVIGPRISRLAEPWLSRQE
jgi:antibiotic biosynthesis monooxygenase (ABM) superfamily enzyme